MKKFLSIALVLVLIVGCFAACGNSKNPAASGTDVPETDETPAVSGETIKIGLLGNTTGDNSQYGIAVFNGAKLYIDEVNAAGGINGKLIEVVEYDEEGDSQKAITGYNSLVDSGVAGIIGSVLTAPTVATVSVAYEDNMPMISASATASAVTYNEESDTVYSNMFRSCFIDPYQGEIMATFAKEELGAATAAVLVNSGSDYSVGVAAAFVETCNELGIEVVASENYAGSDTVDFASQLTNIAAKNPDVLLIPDYYNIIALVAEQAADAGLKTALLGVDGWDTVADYVTDLSLLDGAYYCAGYSTEDTSDAVQGFISNYEAKYGDTPNMFSAQAYDAAAIIVAAMTKVDTEAPELEVGSDDYRQAVVDAMKATDADFVTGHVTYDEYNNPQKTAAIIGFADGASSFWGNFGA